MRIDCPECGGKMVVTHRHPLIPGCTDLYTQCRCGCRAVHTLSLKHTLGSAAVRVDLIASLLSDLPPAEKQAIQMALEL